MKRAAPILLFVEGFHQDFSQQAPVRDASPGDCALVQPPRLHQRPRQLDILYAYE